MLVITWLPLICLIQQTYVCLTSPVEEVNLERRQNSTDAVNLQQNASKIAADAAGNATQAAQSAYNSVPGLLNQYNEFGTSSLLSLGNGLIDLLNNLGNLAGNTVGQLVHTVGTAGELTGQVTGSLVTSAGSIVNQFGAGVGGALNSSGKTIGTTFKGVGEQFTKLGSQTLSVAGHTAAAALNATGGGKLTTRDYTWQG